MKPGRHGTCVTGNWRAGGEFKKVQPTGVMDAPGCGRLRGKLKTRKGPWTAFEVM